MNFSPNTVKAVKQGLTQFKNFCDYKKHDYDFDEIDLQFYHDFTAYLKAEIRTREITYVKIRQQKTGAKVSIPISSECKAILEKYDYNLPKMPDAELNRLLKKICREAGLNEAVEIVETNGGSPTRVTKKKWELVHTHTARRTGATLMYLSGMDVYDIMKVTGHSSPIMLKKYIKADQLEVIEKITDKYNYFD